MIEPAQEANAAPSKRLSIRTRRIVWSLLIACCVFAGFAVYAYTAPTTYRAHAEVVLHAPEHLEGSLYPIADRKQRLVKVLGGPEAMKQIARTLGVTTPDARLELARTVVDGVSITTTDGHKFQITCEHSAAAQAQQLCKVLARISAASLPDAAYRRDVVADRERTKKLEELLEFLAQHPELSDTQASEQPQTEPGKPADALLNVLLHQRQVVLNELTALKRVSPSNPYADGLSQETAQAQIRLGAINAAIAKRKAGLGGASDTATPESDSSALAQLTARLNKLSEVKQPEIPAGALKAVAGETKLPEVPIAPDRARLLVLGALAGLGVGIIGLGFALAARLPSPAPWREAELTNAVYQPPLVSVQGAEFVDRTDLATSPTQLEPQFQPPMRGFRTLMLEAETPSPYDQSPDDRGVDDQSPDDNAVRRPDDHAVKDQSPDDQSPDDRSADEDSPDDRSADEDSPDDRSADEDSPDEDSPDEDSPDEDSPDEDSPDDQGVNDQSPYDRAVEEAGASDDSKIESAPRTRIGGFGSYEPATKLPSRAVSVRTVVALEATVVPKESPIDKAPQTLVGGTQSRAKEAPPARGAYTPPARNITRRLGSLSWLDQAEVGRAPAPTPVSTRYSYVSSRPPPPDAPNQTETAYASELIDTVAEVAQEANPGRSPLRPHERQADDWAQMRHHPLPVGWTLNPALVSVSSKEFADSIWNQIGDACCVVGVTARPDLSPAKSRVAVSLGLQLGQSKRRVLIMEGDFQNPMLHRLLRVEMPMSGGLSQQLQRHLHASDSVRIWDVVQGSETIDILAEGLIRSPGAILSQQFEQCLEDLKGYYDAIVIDGPPLGSSSECRAFADMVDGVVVCTLRDRPDVQSADSIFENKRFVVAHPT